MRGLGIDICGLQEVAKWGRLNGFIYSQMVLLTDRDCDCGFMVSRHLMPAVRNLVFGQFWAALLLQNSIFINVHLHHGDDRGGDVCHEVQQYIHRVRMEHPNDHMHVVLLGDFNVELPNTMGITGDWVLHGRLYPAERSVLAWLSQLSLRALNTFEASGMSDRQLWTWGRGRKRARKNTD